MGHSTKEITTSLITNSYINNIKKLKQSHKGNGRGFATIGAQTGSQGCDTIVVNGRIGRQFRGGGYYIF